MAAEPPTAGDQREAIRGELREELREELRAEFAVVIAALRDELAQSEQARTRAGREAIDAKEELQRANEALLKLAGPLNILKRLRDWVAQYPDI